VAGPSERGFAPSQRVFTAEPRAGLALMAAPTSIERVAGRPVRVWRDSLYLEPVTGCNLRCGLCYSAYDTEKRSRTIPRDQLMALVAQFLDDPARGESPDLFWCGTGEIFLYPRFTELLDEIAERWPAVRQGVQTNGTILPDAPLRAADRVDFRVSIDGLRPAHEANRGRRTYERSIAFARHVLALGSTVLIRCIVTRANIGHLRELEAELHREVGVDCKLSLTLPFDDRAIDRAGSALYRKGFHGKGLPVLLSFSEQDAIAALQSTYEREFLERVCPVVFDSHISIYPAVAVDGVYTCCERLVKVGELSDPLAEVTARIVPATCRGCSMAELCRS
jgi:pyruvate-formate lyase-activating enzyme